MVQEVVPEQQQQQHEVVVEVVHQTTVEVEEPYVVQVPEEVLLIRRIVKHYKNPHKWVFFMPIKY
jgi:hypothetical protein